MEQESKLENFVNKNAGMIVLGLSAVAAGVVGYGIYETTQSVGYALGAGAFTFGITGALGLGATAGPD